MRVVQMGVLVDEVDRDEQVSVGQDLPRSAAAGNRVVLGEDHAPVGDLLEDSRSWVATTIVFPARGAP